MSLINDIFPMYMDVPVLKEENVYPQGHTLSFQFPTNVYWTYRALSFIKLTGLPFNQCENVFGWIL